MVAGGYLEVRSLQLLRGKGRQVKPAVGRGINFRIGTVALVELGGTAIVTG